MLAINSANTHTYCHDVSVLREKGRTGTKIIYTNNYMTYYHIRKLTIKHRVGNIQWGTHMYAAKQENFASSAVNRIALFINPNVQNNWQNLILEKALSMKKQGAHLK